MPIFLFQARQVVLAGSGKLDAPEEINQSIVDILRLVHHLSRMIKKTADLPGRRTEILLQNAQILHELETLEEDFPLHLIADHKRIHVDGTMHRRGRQHVQDFALRL